MSVETYSKTSTTQLTQNFRISEFHCKGSTCGCTQTLHDPQLSAYLQQIRDHFGKPVYITSGYRCPVHNAAVGGSSSSKHASGQAADFYISGVDPLTIAQYAESIGILGIGQYEADYGNFVHIDTRTVKYFWKNTSGNSVETFGGNTNSSTPDEPTTPANPNENNPEDSNDDNSDAPENNNCCDGDCCTSGLITTLSTPFISETSYSISNTHAKFYILTCSLNNTSPLYTVLMDYSACANLYNRLTVHIFDTNSWLNMQINEDDNTVKFYITNHDSNVGYINHIAAYY